MVQQKKGLCSLKSKFGEKAFVVADAGTHWKASDYALMVATAVSPDRTDEHIQRANSASLIGRAGTLRLPSHGPDLQITGQDVVASSPMTVLPRSAATTGGWLCNPPKWVSGQSRLRPCVQQVSCVALGIGRHLSAKRGSKRTARSRQWFKSMLEPC